MINTVLPNKRHSHEKEPFKLLHRSTEFVYKDGVLSDVRSNTLMNPDTIERKRAFVAEVSEYTEARRAAELAKKFK